MMDIELLRETTERMFQRNADEFRNLAESQGMPFAASAMTSALAQTLGLLLAMAKTSEARKATVFGFSAIVDKALAEYGASIEMLETIEKVKQ
jgi:acid phosphatase family membrane protein YuiD